MDIHEQAEVGEYDINGTPWETTERTSEKNSGFRSAHSATAALENVNDSANDPSVVYLVSARLVLRKVRLDHKQSVTSQPEYLSRRSLQGFVNALESQIRPRIK